MNECDFIELASSSSSYLFLPNGNERIRLAIEDRGRDRGQEQEKRGDCFVYSYLLRGWR